MRHLSESDVNIAKGNKIPGETWDNDRMIPISKRESNTTGDKRNV